MGEVACQPSTGSREGRDTQPLSFQGEASFREEGQRLWVVIESLFCLVSLCLRIHICIHPPTHSLTAIRPSHSHQVSTLITAVSTGCTRHSPRPRAGLCFKGAWVTQEEETSCSVSTFKRDLCKKANMKYRVSRKGKASNQKGDGTSHRCLKLRKAVSFKHI